MQNFFIITKRIFFFILTLISVIINIFLFTYLFHFTIFSQIKFALAIAAWGSFISFITLIYSKQLTQMFLPITLINPTLPSPDERKLLDIINTLAKKSGLIKPPQIGIYHSPELNAFTIGPTKNKALLLVSSSLLSNLQGNELEAILAHEISYLRNGDMITLMLMQGILNAFAPFLARIATYAISVARTHKEEPAQDNISLLTYSLLNLVFAIMLSLLGNLMMAAFSCWRIFKADKDSAQLSSPENMIAALERLRSATELEDERAPSMSAYKIAHKRGWFELLSNHPGFKKRIARLKKHAHSTPH